MARSNQAPLRLSCRALGLGGDAVGGGFVANSQRIGVERESAAAAVLRPGGLLTKWVSAGRRPGRRLVGMTDPVTLTLVRYPPRNLSGRRGRRHVRVPLRGVGAAAVGLLWLPAGFNLGVALGGGTGLASGCGRVACTWRRSRREACRWRSRAMLLWRHGPRLGGLRGVRRAGGGGGSGERWRSRASGRSPWRRLRRRRACRRG